MFEDQLENIAQQTSQEFEYGDAWKLNRAVEHDKELKTKVLQLICDFGEAEYSEDQIEMNEIAKKLKELADNVKEVKDEN